MEKIDMYEKSRREGSVYLCKLYANEAAVEVHGEGHFHVHNENCRHELACGYCTYQGEWTMEEDGMDGSICKKVGCIVYCGPP